MKAQMRRYPDLRIFAVVLRAFPSITDSDLERLPAYSGATVPDFHRLPTRNCERFHYASAG
ncbi:MAG: hypothetical protein NVS9B12_02200 [Vulcanimicrobiaceae bacterium]